MLAVNELSCGYGDITAVNKISLSVAPGEIFGLVGANGAGKTSTIMAIAGLISIQAGTVTLNDFDLTTVPAHLRIDKGLALVPEGRRIFADLSVDENLTIGGTRLDTNTLAQNRSEVYNLFPQLKQRSAQRAGSLSGGEQQMLAIGRAVMAQPQLLLVDELSLGLMPTAIDECYEILQRLQQNGIAILLVEQNTERVLKAADHIAVMESGRIVWLGTGNEAQSESAIFDAYLGNL
jgi:branched-chain amino acid transport system ATP-binding protein